MVFVVLSFRSPPISTRTGTRCPDTTRCRAPGIILPPSRREARRLAVVDDLRRAQSGTDAEEIEAHATRSGRDLGAVDAGAAHRRHRAATQRIARNPADRKSGA